MVAFNKPIKCLDEGNRTSEVTKLAQAVDELLQYAGILMYSPIYRFYPTKMWKKFESASDIVFRYSICFFFFKFNINIEY